MFAETACKTSELINLTWKDINLNSKTITLKGAKKGQLRSVKLSDELISILIKRPKRSEIVFMTYYNEPFTTKKISLLINEFKRKTNSTIQWCPMDLRHSFAVNFLTSGGDIKELQYILGHDNVYDTKRLYGEAVNKKLTQDSLNPYE